MKAIGGYFELELRQGEHYHKDAIMLNSGRNCLEYILIARNLKRLYIPYYTCDVLLQPLKRQGVDYSFYHIDEKLDPSDYPTLAEGEAFLYTNYYGLKQRTVEELATRYHDQLIVDNAQAFYAPRIDGIDTFYSPRKFFGVPDGGCLYTDSANDLVLEQDTTSWTRMTHLVKRIDLGPESGYQDFRDADDSLDNAPVLRMSKLTSRILESIDYQSIAEIRQENYMVLHEALKSSNKLVLDLEVDAVPMVYPYLSDDAGLRQRLIDNRVYVARYWPNVDKWAREGSYEFFMSSEMIPLPIDHRLTTKDINRILKIILV